MAGTFSSRLDASESLVDVFELVKESVKRFLGEHRAGLMLGMANLGMRRGSFVGAFHPIGSNIIVLNRAPFDAALRVNDKRVFNGYCFHLLLHEYLHALGYVDEGQVRDLVHLGPIVVRCRRVGEEIDRAAAGGVRRVPLTAAAME